jgi:hypothetical protein
MPACKHESLQYVGEQKTEEGVNSYYTCKSCGSLLVMTPSRKVIKIAGARSGTPPAGKKPSKS